LAILAALLSLAPLRTAQAQLSIDDPALLNQRLDDVRIVGNRITKAEIILREMITQPGSVTDERRLRADLHRVEDLNLFNRVEFRLARLQDQTVLIITVTEEWYIFPQPYWLFKDNDPEQMIYGFRYMQKNFRGRNETLNLDLWNGYDRGFSFAHSNPWVQNTPELSRRVELRHGTAGSRREALKDLGVEERHSSAGVLVGKRWTIDLSSYLGGSFRLIRGEHPLQTASPGMIDRLMELRTGIVWDARDSHIFPRSGVYLEGGVINGWIMNTAQGYRRLNLDARWYYPFTGWALASRLHWVPGWGNLPPYDWIFMNGTSPLRSARLEDEGNSFYMASLEARVDLIPVRYFTWKSAPLFKQYFRNLGFGLSSELFVDAGDAYFSGHDATRTHMHWGYGGGLLFILPYVDVVRLELSWNPEYSWDATQYSFKTNISF